MKLPVFGVEEWLNQHEKKQCIILQNPQFHHSVLQSYSN